MAETSSTSTLVSGWLTAKNTLRDIKTRPVLAHKLWRGGSFGDRTPTAQEWHTGRVPVVGNIMSALIRGSVELTLSSHTQAGIPLRTLEIGRMSDLMYTKKAHMEEPIMTADIVSVTNVITRSGNVPILGLEFLRGAPETSYVLTVPDLAYNVQAGRIALNAAFNIE